MLQDFRKSARVSLSQIVVFAAAFHFIGRLMKEEYFNALGVPHWLQSFIALAIGLTPLYGIYAVGRKSNIVRRLPSPFRGVCRGLEAATGIDRNLFQLAFIVLACTNGEGLWIYLTLAAGLPEIVDQPATSLPPPASGPASDPAAS